MRKIKQELLIIVSALGLVFISNANADSRTQSDVRFHGKKIVSQSDDSASYFECVGALPMACQEESDKGDQTFFQELIKAALKNSANNYTVEEKCSYYSSPDCKNFLYAAPHYNTQVIPKQTSKYCPQKYPYASCSKEILPKNSQYTPWTELSCYSISGETVSLHDSANPHGPGPCDIQALVKE